MAPPVHLKPKRGASDTLKQQVGSLESMIETLVAQSRTSLNKGVVLHS